MPNLDENTFLGMFLDANNIVVDTCIFAEDATEEHMQEVLDVKKQLNETIMTLITSNEYGNGGIDWELHEGYLRPPQPFFSFTWNELLKTWEPPTPYPNDGKDYIWNENILNWEEIQVLE